MHGANSSGNFQRKYGANMSIRTTAEPLNHIILCIFHTKVPYILLWQLRERGYLGEEIQDTISAAI
jgi:hypothetical protein